MANKNNNQSFVRWQGRTIQQFGFVNNLLLGLATGLLAFETQLAFGEIGATLSQGERQLIAISLLLVFISLAAGSWLALNRLSAFRTTTTVARKRETGERTDIDELRETASRLDERSWFLLKAQTALFAVGALVLVGTALVRLL